MIRSLINFTALAVCLFGLSTVANSETAKTVVYIAKDIITMDPATPRAQAVAVADGRILGVGSQEAMIKLSGGTLASIDRRFADKVIVPGLIEPHIHPVLAALSLTMEIISIEDWLVDGKTYAAVRSQEGYIQRLRESESLLADPATPLLSWGFHHYFHGKLTRDDLDAISTTRPIMIWHRSCHEFILNTAAIEAVGLNADMVLSEPQAIQEQTNLAEGHFWERGMFEFLLPKLMPFIASEQQVIAGLELTERYLHAAGVTTSAEPAGLASMYSVQNTVLGDEATPFRFYFIPDGRMLALSHQGDALIAATEEMIQGMSGHTAFLPKQVKLFTDGAIFSQLMQMQDGYTDKHQGEWMMMPENYARTFKTYWDAGYQIHIHQNGDAGLEIALQVLEQNMRRNPRNNHRTTLVHFGFATTQQVQRIAALGAIVSANPYYTVALADRYGEVGIGPERADEMVRLGDVSRAGISISLHSDMPMAPAQPLFLAWAAVNRTTFSGRVAGPEQRLTAEQALKAITLDAAYSLQLENEIGSITPGKRANFTILEQNPLQVETMTIKDIGIWGTVLEGRLQPLPLAATPSKKSELH